MICSVCRGNVPGNSGRCTACGTPTSEPMVVEVLNPTGLYSGPPRLGIRIASTLLDLGIFTFSLGIGWIVWQVLLLRKSTSPAKSLLNLEVRNLRTASSATPAILCLRILLIPITTTMMTVAAYLLLSLTGRPVSTLWALTLFQVSLVLFYVLDFGSILLRARSRLTDRVLRLSVSQVQSS